MALRTVAFNDTKTYGFEWLRGMLEVGHQEGVLNFAGAGTDMMVTQRAAGVSMALDIAAGAALVKGDSGSPALGLTQGLVLAINDAAATSAVTLDASEANPRIDQIVLKLRDSSDLGTGADDVTFAFVKGTATVGATLDNRTGAAALPSDCLRLADVLVAGGAVSVSNTSIRDRRPKARGYFVPITRNANAGGTNDYTATTLAVMDATNLNPRIECSGAPVRVTLAGQGWNTVVSEYIGIEMRMDGAQLNGGTPFTWRMPVAAYPVGFGLTWTIPAPAAGSHRFAPWLGNAGGAGTATVAARAATPLQMTVEEIVKDTSPANSVTSG